MDTYMKRGFDSMGSKKSVIAVFAFLVVSAFALGSSRASAASSSMTITPSSQTVSQGATVSATLNENSGADSVNGVQASLTYPADKLVYTSVTYAGSSFDIQTGATGGNGVVKFSVGKTPAGLTGSQVVAVINFKAIGTGSANIAFGCDLSSGNCSDGNAVTLESDSSNILSTETGATATLNETDFDQLTSGQTLTAGQSLISRNVVSMLIMQGDGNLVLYSGGRPVWSSGTYGRGATHALMQGDGNLVLYTAGNVPIWATNTFGHNNSSLVMQDDGNLVIYSSTSVPLWATSTGGHASATYAGTDRLLSGGTLTINKYLRSQDGRYAVALQGDGNLVSYGAGYSVRFSTGTGGRGVTKVVMQTDGNIVLYTASNVPKWQSDTVFAGPSYLVIQNDGNLVSYRYSNGAPGWTPGSHGFLL
jgi:hypothetical protein